MKNDEAKTAAGGAAGAAAAGGGRRTPEAWKNQYAQQQKGVQDKGGPVVVDDEDDDEDDDEEKISVPLTITMAIIGLYIFMGALLFGVWEKWDPLKASYFCFVTVSTIGFGDVVPGSANFETAADQWKMLGAAVYMLFGMAILSMCFSLIQEEIVAKFRWVGEKLGIIEKEKDEADDDEDDDDVDPKNKQPTNPKAGPPPPPPAGAAKAGMPPGKPGAGPPGGYPPVKGGHAGPPPAPIMPSGQKPVLQSVPPAQHRPPPMKQMPK